MVPFPFNETRFATAGTSLLKLSLFLISSVHFKVNNTFWDLCEATGLSLLVENRERDVTVCNVVPWMPEKLFRVPEALAE